MYKLRLTDIYKQLKEQEVEPVQQYKIYYAHRTTDIGRPYSDGHRRSRIDGIYVERWQQHTHHAATRQPGRSRSAVCRTVGKWESDYATSGRDV